MPLDPHRVEEIFNTALEQASAEERAAFLDRACADDEGLRNRVEALLRAHVEASQFLRRPAIEQFAAALPCATAATTRLESCPDAAQPQVARMEEHDDSVEPLRGFLRPATRPDALGRLGHYEVLEVLGQGGFGIVVKAFDDRLQRVVAIKILSPALAMTSPARKRFLREARAAAARKTLWPSTRSRSSRSRTWSWSTFPGRRCSSSSTRPGRSKSQKFCVWASRSPLAWRRHMPWA